MLARLWPQRHIIVVSWVIGFILGSLYPLVIGLCK